MHIWLVTNLESSPSSDLIKESCLELGWTCEHIVPSRQSYNLTAPDIEQLFADRKIKAPDFCFVRMGSAAPAEGLALVTKIAALGIPCASRPQHLIPLRDKASSLIKMHAAKVPLPRTLIVGAGYNLEHIIEQIPKAPWILKTRFSTKGLGVMLVDSRRALSSAIDTLLSSHLQILVQEFIADRSGADVRVLVVDGQAVACMQRQSQNANEFRSNLYLGATGSVLELSKEVADIATNATSSVELDIAGVDLLGSPGNFYVAEVNTSPGLAGISKAVGRNLARDVLVKFADKFHKSA